MLGEVDSDEGNQDDDDKGLSNIFAGLRQEIVNRSGLKIDLDVGIKVRWPPDPFLRGKFRRQWTSEKWSFRIKESPYWFTQDGFGHKTDLDLDRRFSKDRASRASLRYKWEDDDDVNRLVSSLSFFRLSGERIYLGLVGSTFWDDEGRPFSVRGYTAAFRLRRLTVNGCSPRLSPTWYGRARTTSSRALRFHWV